MNNDISSILKELVIANATDKTIKYISDDTDLITDLSYDSIDTIKLVVDIEKKFNIEFPDDLFLLDNIRYFSALYDVVYECLKKKHNNNG